MAADNHDVTAERQQRLLALLATHVPASACLLDDERRILSHTHVDARLFAAEDEELVGLSLLDALAAGVAERAEVATLLDAASGQRQERASPCVQVPLAADVRSLRVRVLPVDDEEARLLVVIEDATELLAPEAQAESLASLAGTVAHEIRNPLAGISGTLQILASSVDEPKREILEKVQVQIRRVNALVQELLSFSRPLAPKRETVELHEVAARAASTAQADGFGAAEVTGAGRATADGGQLSQVLLSLVQNAYQAGAGHVRVEVEDGRVSVLDDGPGIPDEHKERIFEPFFTTRTRGTGLGLPMARKAVEAMGGRLSVCPSPLGGAGFLLKLPAAAEG